MVRRQVDVTEKLSVLVMTGDTEPRMNELGRTQSIRPCSGPPQRRKGRWSKRQPGIHSEQARPTNVCVHMSICVPACMYVHSHVCI